MKLAKMRVGGALLAASPGVESGKLAGEQPKTKRQDNKRIEAPRG